MKDDFRELVTSIKSMEAYEVYKHCMYLPTKEKYDAKVDDWLNNDNIKAFAYYEEDDTISGMLVMLLQEEEKAEIVGISVAPSSRGQGIGSYMIRKLLERYRLKELIAETDDDAIEFYVRNGFEAKKLIKTYDGQEVVRYHCVLRK